MNNFYTSKVNQKNIASAVVCSILISLGFCCQVLLCSSRAKAQSPVAQVSTADAWQVETWNNSNAVFNKIRADFDLQIASGQKASQIAERVRPAAHRNDTTGLPENMESVLRYSYAAYQAAKQDHSENYLADAVNAMDRVLPTHSYQFARVHFLLNGILGNTLGLRPIGQRLLKRDPTDSQVKYYFVLTLHPGKTATDRQLALTYTAQLIHQFPANPKTYALQGYVYDIANAENHDPKDGDRAIAAYRHYLKVAPANDDFRAAALSHIKSVQMLQRVQRRTQGTKKPSRPSNRRPAPVPAGG